MKHIDKIIRTSIKEAFRYEDRELTPWLTDNIDVISEAIGVGLTNASREQSTGNFSVDIKAESEDGRIVVIENQFGKSDHDHLGKLITYLTAFEAEIAIWIVENARPEHINAISWLNESANQCDFYLLTIEAIRIGDSSLAPLLTQIIGPSEEAREIGKVKKEDSVRHKKRIEFWTMVLEQCRLKNISRFDAISPTKDAWIGASAGFRGLSYNFWANQHSCRIELRIDRGKGSEEKNLKILRELELYKDEISQVFGAELNWEELEGYRVCSIRKDYQTGGYKDEPEKWGRIIGELVNGMNRLINATEGYIKALKL